MEQAPRAHGGAPLLKAREVAEWLRVSINTVHRLAETGELASHRVGRLRRFDAAAVEAYLEKVAHTSDPTPLRPVHSA